MPIEFSQKELKLFERLGYLHFVKDIQDPLTIYRICAEKVFMSNKQGPEVDSIRRCLKAMYDFSPHRLTEEWDALIQLEEDKKVYIATCTHWYGENDENDDSFVILGVFSSREEAKKALERSNETEPKNRHHRIREAVLDKFYDNFGL